MGELEEKLNSILGDPQAMSQIMALASSLGGGGASAPPPSGEQQPSTSTPSTPTPPTPSPAASAGGGAPDLSALAGLLTGGEGGGVDPRLLTLASRVMQEYRRDDDGKAALLLALRPYVQEKRYAKLDKAVQIAKLSRLIRVALDVFKGGEQGNV